MGSKGRALVAAIAIAAVCWPVAPSTAGSGPPPSMPALTADALNARYAANRVVLGTGPLARPDRQILEFGGGRVVEVFGDLAAAERIAVLVPGSDTRLSTYDGDHAGGARALSAEARRLFPDARFAVVAWLGYDPPATFSLAVAGDGRARAGARDLRRFVAALRGNGVAVSLVCHSYGSVVCAHAADATVSDVVVFGSPGMPALAARGPRLWATRGSTDWIRRVPHLRLFGGRLGLGADPVAPGSGARVFSSGTAGHSDYLRPGSRSLHRITLAAFGAGALVPTR